LRVHDEPRFGGDFFAVPDRQHVHARGFQIVNGGIGSVIGAQ